MTHPDTLWYHGPYAAQFVQSGRLTGLLAPNDALHAFAGQTSELVHALLILPYGRDILSPFVNVGWAAIALLAAWCIGRRAGAPALSLLGVVVVLGLPVIVATHPGQASNDLAAGALLLAAIALLLEAKLHPIPTGFAAVAAGLALSIKLTVAAPIALLTIGVVVAGLRARRRATVASWLGLLVASGSYWFVRNIAVADRPIPWFGFHLGPISLPATAHISGSTAVAHYIANGQMWTKVFLPGLAKGLGPVWPLVLALALGGLVVSAGRRPLLDRVVGGAFLVGLIAYVYTPVTGAAGGLAFAFNLRYLGPTLLVGLAVWPLALDHFSAGWRRGASILLVAVVAVDLTAGNHERTPASPQGYVLVAILAGAAVITAAVMLPKLQRMTLLHAAIAGLLVVVVAVTAGWWIQRNYLQHRYLAAGLPLDRVNAYFRNIRNATVAVVGTVQIYPMFGLNLSNRVTPVTKYRGANPCVQWQQILSTQYRYIVVAQFGFGSPELPPRGWFDTSAATPVVHEHDGTVYRIEGPLRPAACFHLTAATVGSHARLTVQERAATEPSQVGDVHGRHLATLQRRHRPRREGPRGVL